MTEAARLEGIILLTGLDQARSGLRAMGKDVDRAQAGLDGLGKQSERTSKQTDKLGESLIKSGKQMQRAGGHLTRGVTLPLVAMGAATLKVGADFDAQMSKVQAKAGASAQDLAKLRAQAIKLGADTSFSAREAAQGMEELAAAGMKPREVLKAMPGLLDAAAASGEGVGAVAAIMANTLAQFNLDASESARIADVLAKGSNETQASIGSMGESLKYAGTQASQLGFDLEQTVGMTSAMVKAGIDGGQAGTALRMGLMQVAKGANASKLALKRLGGISPELKEIWKSAAPVPEKIKLMSSEFQKLDGTTRTVAAGLIFGTEASSGMLEVMKGGPAQIDKWTKSMRDSGGEAKRMGDTMRNNLKGDIEALGGSIESAMINMFAQADGPMRGLTQSVTGMVNAFGNMGPAGQTAAMGLGVMAAAAGPALVAAGSLVRAYGSLKVAAQGSAMTARLAGLAMNPYALGAVALGAAVIGVTAAVKKQNREEEEARQKAIGLVGVYARRKDAAMRLEKAQGAVSAATDAMDAAERKYGQRSAQYRKALEDRKKAAKDAADAQRDLNKAVDEAKEGGGDGKGADGGKKLSAGEETQQRAKLIETEKKLASAVRDRVRAQQAAARQRVDTGATAQITPLGMLAVGDRSTAADQLRTVAAARKKLNDEFRAGITVGDAYTTRARALDNVERTAKRTLDETASAVKSAAQRSRELRGEQATLARSLGDVSLKAQESAQRISQMTRTPGNLRAARDMLKDMTGMERKALFGTKSINRILGDIGNTSTSGAAKSSFGRDLEAMRLMASRGVTVRVNYVRSGIGAKPGGGLQTPGGAIADKAMASAKGRIVKGPGTGTSDDILSWVSNGEGIIPERSTSANREVVEWMIDNPGKKLPLPGYAKGKNSGKPLTARERAQNKLAGIEAKNALKVANAEVALAKAEASLKRIDDDRKALLRLAGEHAGEEARLTKFSKSKAYKKLSAQDKAGVQSSIASARRAKLSALEQRRRLLQDKRDREKKAREAKAEKDKADQEKLDQEALDAENLRREALGLESVEDEKRRLAMNEIRRAAGLSEIPAGGDTESPDLAAQLAQAQQRASIAEANARYASGALSAFTGTGDIGYGGGSAWSAAQGQTIIHVNALQATAPETLQSVAAAANGGNMQGGNADRFYSGRR